MQSKYGINGQFAKPVSVATDSGTRINRLELTRDLCDLESFVMSPARAAKTVHETQGYAFDDEIAQTAYTPQIARKIDFSQRGFLTEEYPEPETLAHTPHENCARIFDPTPAPVVRPAFSFEDRVSMARLLENEATEMDFEAPERVERVATKPAPKPANPFFDTQAERRPLPSWMWTLISFGGCGTACGAVILAQKFVGMPISAGILNLGLSIFVSGCAMFALAGGLAFTRKNKLAF